MARRATELEAPPMLSPASRDPFNSTPAAPPPTEAKAAPEPVRNEPPPQPPAPTAPPMTHRILGRFQSPEGERLVFLQDGAQAVLATPGAVLSSGYVVETVTPREIRLRHPLAEQPVSLPLSAEPVAPEDNAP